MIITEIELRELWRDGRQALPTFPPGTRFSPAAQDFIKDHQLEIRFANTVAAPVPATELPITNYQLPAALDTLHSLILLVAAEARQYQLPALARRLDVLAGYCLELRAAEQQRRAPASMVPVPAGNSPEFAPSPTDHAILHWLNFLRATARQAAAQAAVAGNAPMAAALEQVSATAASLGRQVQSGELGWNSPMV
jgi:hypothetical protein